jgi:hypothetical protein
MGLVELLEVRLAFGCRYGNGQLFSSGSTIAHSDALRSTLAALLVLIIAETDHDYPCE